MKLSLPKLLSSIVVTLLALIYAMPNFTNVSEDSIFPSNSLNLGLDLRGGSHLLLHVGFEQYVEDQLSMSVDSIRKELRANKVGYKGLSSRRDNISLSLRKAEDYKKLYKAVKKLDSSFIIEQQEKLIKISYSEEKKDDMQAKLIDQSIEIIRMRVDETGTKEPIIQKQGSENILLQVPGLDDPSHLKNLLGRTAKMTFHLVDNIVINESRPSAPVGSMLIRDEYGNLLSVKKRALLSGDMLNDSNATFNERSQPAVAFSFNTMGGKIFADLTKANSGKRFAIILDGKLLSAPVINEPILGGSGIITGNFTVESANDLSLLLRAGALPAPLKVVEERTVGPNLGADSIESGKLAGFVGFMGVVIFMIWTYGVWGIFANIALLLSMLYLTAMLSAFQATLTLPGIAGIILTIGMAVDANVLIYERIREELQRGASNLYAIRNGFDSAFATITDSNVTTLIAASLLYSFGVGAIKGFAVTLTIGIISSMFAAIVITKLFIDLWMIIVKPTKINL